MDDLEKASSCFITYCLTTGDKKRGPYFKSLPQEHLDALARILVRHAKWYFAGSKDPLLYCRSCGLNGHNTGACEYLICVNCCNFHTRHKGPCDKVPFIYDPSFYLNKPENGILPRKSSRNQIPDLSVFKHYTKASATPVENGKSYLCATKLPVTPEQAEKAAEEKAAVEKRDIRIKIADLQHKEEMIMIKKKALEETIKQLIEEEEALKSEISNLNAKILVT
jgi:hypothetical protein